MDKTRRQERGSALVETAILMVVMIPVVFGLVMIGNMIDLKQTSEQAGRYAAWEATVYPQSGVGGDKPSAIKERFFGDPSNTLSSQASEAGTNPLWGDAGDAADRSWQGRTAVRIDESSASAEPYQRGVGDGSIAMRVGQVAASAGEVLDGLSGNSWGLTSNGLVKGTVAVQVQANDWMRTAGLDDCGSAGNFACLQSSSVILVDGWSASSDDQARRRVRSLVPASALEPLGDVISNVGRLPMFKELRQLDGAFGHVDMNVLPEYAR